MDIIKLVIVVMVLLSAELCHSQENSTTDNPDSHKRVKRFFGLFNVVQFNNNVCNTTDTTKQGVCYTANECNNLRGRASGTCAMGFGVCCIFEFSCDSLKNDGQEVFYFQNPKYPTAEDNPLICLFSMSINSPSICQIRMDFVDFELDGGSAVDMPCNHDSLEVISADGASNLGMGKLCGKNTGQNIYLPIRSQTTTPMLRIVTDSRATTTNYTTPKYKWYIKVTQIDCSSANKLTKDLLAPPGCLQYYMLRTGTISSFNWNPAIPRQYMKNQNYAICFRRSETDCKIEFKRSTSAPPYSTSVGPYTSQGGSMKCSPENGCGQADCINIDQTNPTSTNTKDDYLLIPNGYYYKTTTAGPGVQQKYVFNTIYCGVGIGRDFPTIADGTDDRSGVISQGSGPFVVIFNSDSVSSLSTTNANNNPGQNELGFSLDYSISASCTPLVQDNP